MLVPYRHFLDLSDFSPEILRGILEEAKHRKARRKGLAQGEPDSDLPLRGRVLATLFEKPSTRTRISFDIALKQLGGEALILSASDLQLGRGETLADTARVLSRYVDGIVLRTFGHERLLEIAHHAHVPVINGLTDFSHPCQILADILTFEECFGSIQNKIVTWCGDVCNVAHSWIHAAWAFDFEFRLSHPPSLPLLPEVAAWAREKNVRFVIEPDPIKAVRGAHCVVTDTWFSMNEARTDQKIQALLPYQINAALMAHTSADTIFMHCLPCHRGEEVTEDVVDGPRSRIFDEAENRVHAQKAILTWCFANS